MGFIIDFAKDVFVAAKEIISEKRRRKWLDSKKTDSPLFELYKRLGLVKKK